MSLSPPQFQKNGILSAQLDENLQVKMCYDLTPNISLDCCESRTNTESQEMMLCALTFSNGEFVQTPLVVLLSGVTIYQTVCTSEKYVATFLLF